MFVQRMDDKSKFRVLFSSLDTLASEAMQSPCDGLHAASRDACPLAPPIVDVALIGPC